MKFINKFLKDKFIIIFLATVILLILFYYFNLFSPLENKFYDLLLVIKQLIEPVNIDDIIIVAIDDKTLNTMQDWPFPRSYYARVINTLEDAGARAIGLDLIFTEHSLVKEDRQLEEVLKSYDNIVIPVVAKLNLVRYLHKNKIETDNFIRPVDIFTSNAKLGHINFIPDRDGIIRCLPVSLTYNNKKYLPFARELVDNSIDYVKDYSYLINFPGPSGTIPRVSFIDILQSEYQPDFLNDKYILIGSMATGLGDRYTTSFSRYGYLSGIELQAQYLYNIINKSYIKKISFSWNLLILIIILIFAYLLFVYFQPLKVFIILIITNVIYLTIALYLFYYKRILLYLLAPVVSTLVISAISLIYWYYFSERDKKMLIKSFSRYLSPRVIDSLQKNPSQIELGGENVYVTVMFVDIRNFTDYTEGKSPQEITATLNKFFTQVVNILFKYSGTLDKYLGDGVMAFFGAPLVTKSHREQAFLAALEILEYIEQSNFSFNIGIGINSGQVIAGNVGSQKRMNYTIIGDAVNKAAKYVEIARPGELVIGYSTYNGMSCEHKQFNWKQDYYKQSQVYKLTLNT